MHLIRGRLEGSRVIMRKHTGSVPYALVASWHWKRQSSISWKHSMQTRHPDSWNRCLMEPDLAAALPSVLGLDLSQFAVEKPSHGT